MEGLRVLDKLEEFETKLNRIEEMVNMVLNKVSPRSSKLTERQKNVLLLKQVGLDDQSIAERLKVSRPYVTQIVKVLRKKGYQV